MSEINFISEYCQVRISTAIAYYIRASIAARNVVSTGAGTTVALVDRAVNDVAITTIPTSPIDQATGLPIPTIAVATDGGVSVITDSGDVWNMTRGLNEIVAHISFTNDNRIIISNISNHALYVAPIPTADLLSDTEYGGSVYFNGGTPSLSPIAMLLRASCLHATATSFGLTHLKENPTTPGEGMVAYTTASYTTGWMHGYIKGAWVPDFDVTSVVGSELVTISDFTDGSDGSSTVTESGGTVTATYVDGNPRYHHNGFATEIGKEYIISVDILTGTMPLGIYAGNVLSSSNTFVDSLDSIGINQVTFTATATTTFLTIADGQSFSFKDLSCRLAIPDRSVNNNGIGVHGTLSLGAVATGAELTAFSGFSAANYLEQPYNADMSNGTGAFYRLFWHKQDANTILEGVYARGTAVEAQRDEFYVIPTGETYFICDDDTSVRVAISTETVDDGEYHLYLCEYDGAGGARVYRDGSSTPFSENTGAALLTLDNATATFRLGLRSNDSGPNTNGAISQFRAGSGNISSEQFKYIYETEKHLFQENVDCTFAGTSDSVLALDYDEDTEQLHAMTSYGRSTFSDLSRVSSEATPVGAPVAVSGSGGDIAQAGSTGADFYSPVETLRAELKRVDEQAVAFGSALEPIWDLGVTSKTDFPLPAGFKPKAVYNAGFLVKEGVSDEYTVEYDGFIYTVVFAVAPTAGNDICFMSTRGVK